MLYEVITDSDGALVSFRWRRHVIEHQQRSRHHLNQEKKDRHASQAEGVADRVNGDGRRPQVKEEVVAQQPETIPLVHQVSADQQLV